MSGPWISEEGDVISSNLAITENYNDATTALYGNLELVSGQIQKVYTVDNLSNSPDQKGTVTVCDVMCRKPDGTTEVARRCMFLQPTWGGAINNFQEIIPPDPGPQALDGSISSGLKRGSFVLVGFMNGYKTNGIVLGALPHSNKAAVARRPKKSKGTYLEQEFQGLNIKYNNDGSYKVTFNGPRNDKGALIGSDGPSSWEFDTSGNIKFQTNANQSIEINRVENKINVINGTTTLILEKDKVLIETETVNVTAKKDAKIDVKGNATVAAIGTTTIASQEKINLSRGETIPNEPFVLGKKFVEFMKEFLGAVGQIRHLGNLAAPTPPPINASKFKELEGKLDTLLSDLIMGNK